MNFVYEDLENKMNLLSGNVEVEGDNNLAKYFRFNQCPIANDINDAGNINLTLVKYLNPKEYAIEKRPKRYIIPVGVNQSPREWIGGFDKENKITGPDYIFSNLRKEYIKDLQSNRAYLLVDSSLEGYHDDIIFDYFHSYCLELQISPSRIIFVSGNLELEKNYNRWFYTTEYTEALCCIGFPHFELEVYKNLWERKYKEFVEIIDYDSHVKYKESKLNEIKLYSCTNKRPRPHRIKLFKELVNSGLLDKGVVSMDSFEASEINEEGIQISTEELKDIAPLTPLYPYGLSLQAKPTSYYIKRFNERHALDSWVNVVSEARFDDSEKTLFLSEKIFKAIALQQPFIIVGNKGSLKRLRAMGYETFNEYFDESYDELEGVERIDKIIELLVSLDSIENKLQWYKSMKSTFERNSFALQHSGTKSIMPQFKNLLTHYFRY